MDLPQKTDDIIAKCRTLRGVKHVYFEPPENLKMEYPCVRIARVNADVRRADNRAYTISDRYKIIYITREPDSQVVHDILELFEKIRLDNSSTADGLHHDYYTLFY